MLPLNFRYLAQRMFLARDAEQQHAERYSTEAVAEEKSHNALAQLSASAAVCKDESAVVGRDRWARRIVDQNYDRGQEEE